MAFWRISFQEIGILLASVDSACQNLAIAHYTASQGHPQEEAFPCYLHSTAGLWYHGRNPFPFRRPGRFRLLFGPVFTREVVIAPRRTRIYIARSAYAAALLLLICTAWLVLTGTQIVRDVSDLAQFAGLVFQILAPLQLALAVFFSAMLAASAVAQEKDRRTFVLLLLTNLSNQELVLGKLLASLLQVLVMFAAGLPVFMLLALLGGISVGTDRTHGGGHGGQHPRLRQPRLDAGAVAGKDLSGPGPVRADPRPLAGLGRDARRRRPWDTRPPACPPTSGRRPSVPGRRSLRPRGPPRSRSPAGNGSARRSICICSWRRPWPCCSTDWPCSG